MKRIYIFLFFTILTGSAHAQFRLGAKISLTNNNLYFQHTEDAVYTPVETFCANAGIVVNYKINRWLSFQSELIYNPFNVNVTVDTYYMNIYSGMHSVSSTSKIRIQYLEIPLLAKVTLLGNHKINLDLLGGAFVDYRLSAKQKTDSNPFQNVTSGYTKHNAGFTVGVGMSIMEQRLFFEIRSNVGLVDIDVNNTTKVSTIQAMYTVGYYLFRGKKK